MAELNHFVSIVFNIEVDLINLHVHESVSQQIPKITHGHVASRRFKPAKSQLDGLLKLLVARAVEEKNKVQLVLQVDVKLDQ